MNPQLEKLALNQIVGTISSREENCHDKRGRVFCEELTRKYPSI